MPKIPILKLSITLTLVFSLFFMPSARTQRAHAILGVGDINLESVPTVVRFMLETIAFPIAQTMIDDITRSTIDWANTGFEGSPAYNINPEAYLIDLADKAAGKVINDELQFLCSPFRDKIRLSLSMSYYQPPQEYFQCTFSEAFANVEDFYQGFNSGGGWDTWFEMTQRPTNNPYGAYLAAQERINSKIYEESTGSRDELNQSSGYFNWRSCSVRNPDESVLNKIRDDMKSGKQRAPDRYQAPYDLSKQPGECIEQGDIVSPGTSIKSALETTFAAPVAKLINADSVDQLLSAFMTGLLKRYVFARGDTGLFSSKSVGGLRELIDIDDDGIPDGYDTDSPTEDGYGTLDICSHGIENPDEEPSNTNCRLSKSVTSSPFYLPICEKLDITVAELNRHLEFVSENAFKKSLSNLWLNKTLPATSAVGDFMGILSRLEVTESKFLKTMEAVGTYSKDLDKIAKSLAKDGDLKEGWKSSKVKYIVPGLGLFSQSDNDAKSKHVRNTQKIIDYLESFQETLVQNCSNPDFDALSEIPVPETQDIPDGEIGNSDTTIGGGESQASGSCYATPEEVTLGEPVTWISPNTLQNATYSWSGDEISARTTPTVSITYSTAGGKSASVSISGTDSSGQQRTINANCLNSVTVTSSVNN